MYQKYNNIDENLLNDIVIKSNSFVEVTKKLGFESQNFTARRNIERLIKRKNISTEHFESVKRVREYTLRYNEENLRKMVEISLTLKDILLNLDILPIDSNYKTLKKYLKKYNINHSYADSKLKRITSNYDEEKLKKIVSESYTITEVIKKLGLRAAGGNYKTIRSLLMKYNINTSHFDPNRIRIEKLTQINKSNINDCLVENSTYNRGHLKKRLYDEGYKERKCELCGQDEYWKDKKMSLILDHKNGVWNDNRIENLQIVCGNCNATLDTHCGKNKSKKDVNSFEDKTDFRKTITKEKIDSYLLKRKVNRPEHSSLISDISILGYSATGRKYGVSDNAIRKWIKTYEKIKI